MPPRRRSVLVIGSGPIIIGQAAEFDYAGVQACRALREEGHHVVLVNSNPATIMTDPGVADAVYLEPLTASSLEAIIARERPDALLPTLGGQTGLNLAVELAEAGVLERYELELLGTPVETITLAEDRALFKQAMLAIGEPVPESIIVTDIEAGVAFGREAGYPLVIRPAYTLGGTGGGVVYDESQMRETLARGLGASLIHQALVETSLLGWKEVEYEVLRDRANNCIIVCNMENVDPVGVHTGDSIVVAPSQTLSDREYQLLRTASLNVIRALRVQGGCNIQFALHPQRSEYRIIEVNPRVSRSSALASKATGYPIAKIATKLALGQTLDEIPNPVTGVTKAAYEPTLDYVVVKFPRWPFDKFPRADTRLGTQMKSTGEAMAIGRTFAAALLKAVRGLDLGRETLTGGALENWSDDDLERLIAEPTHERLFAVAEALRRGRSVEEIAAASTIDRFWLWEIEELVRLEERLRRSPNPAELRLARESGYSTRGLERLIAARRRPAAADASSPRAPRSALTAPSRTFRRAFGWSTPPPQSSRRAHRTITSRAGRAMRCAARRATRSSSSGAARSASVKGSSSTTRVSTRPGHCATPAARRSSSTTTRRRSRLTSTSATSSSSSRREPTRCRPPTRRRARVG
jgi:carbamoyl-phosphate synthase large subunit